MADSLALEPLEALPLGDRVYRRLREAILDMDVYGEGADLRLDERGLAERLGASRTPVREALLRLQQDGLVEVRPRRGAVVVRRSLAEVVETVTVWAALESMAARLACARASDADLAALERLGLAEAGGEEYSAANVAFHRRIVELSANALLIRMAGELFEQMRAVRRHAMRLGDRPARSLEAHAAIVAAVRARDADRAGDLVRDHALDLAEHLRATWKERADG